MLGVYCRTSKDSETSIEQQKKLGIEFAVSNNFQFESYEDEGISGFKISDDDIDPFNNRPAFTTLINDIKAKKITKVWVYEHSRLSRNQYASAAIFNIFEKYNIELYENGKKLDLNDPQFQMMRQILDAISQYERHLIVNRTTRGLYNAIDKGTRGYSKFYGYENAGKKENGKTNWKPIESKLNNIKYAYTRILENTPIRQIVRELNQNKLISKKEWSTLQSRLIALLRHFEYTGHCFNFEGTAIYQKLLNGETENVSALNNRKYFVKSVPYPVELISIEDWFKVFEKLVINKRIFRKNKETSFKRASKGLATGIIECPSCHFKYYSWSTAKATRTMKYVYYKHATSPNIEDCNQHPKSFRNNKTDEIFKLFFFYNALVFDTGKQAIDESLFLIKQEITKKNEKLEQVDNSLNKNNKSIEKFNKAIESTDEVGTITVIAKRLSDLENKNNELSEEKASLIIDINNLNKKYVGTELEKVYYNTTERVSNFFNAMNTEEQRNTLIKTIKCCYSFNKFILIDTGTVIFIFNTKRTYKFKDDMLNNLDKNYLYKKYFIESLAKEKVFLDIADQFREDEMKGKIFDIDEQTIYDCKLKGKNKLFNNRIAEMLFGEYNINYDFSGHTNIVFFFTDF
jgi:DNA invertase Pin-like site-specific DNA recombinase